MNDFWRESFSYFGLYRELSKVKKVFKPEKVSFGGDKHQYFYFFEPSRVRSDKVIVWIHGGGWNAGTPEDFDYVGQFLAGEGYRFVSLGYRLSPKNKYPAQIEDVCEGFNRALHYLKERSIDVSKIILCGPSAGAHLSSILAYSKEVQERYSVDVSNVIGFVGWGGPYSIDVETSWVLKFLMNQLFAKGYDRKQAEPVSLMSKNHIPMLLIQSKHDGLIEYSSAEAFKARAIELGNQCEIYEVVDKLNTHSWYTAGIFLKKRTENKGLDKFLTWIEEL